MIDKAEPYEVFPTKLAKRKRRIGVVNHVEILRKGTGELLDQPGYVMEEVTVDVSPFIKVYDTCVFKDLSLQGLRLLGYVMDNVGYDGVVRIDVKEALSWIGKKSASSVYYGIQDLLDNDVVRVKGGGEYFVNPNIVSKGTRCARIAE